MIWIDHREMKRLPINGQEVWYFLPEMGVFRGVFTIDKSAAGREMHERWGVSLNLFVCSEVAGVVDSDDVPCWMPYESGSSRPLIPEYWLDQRHQEFKAECACCVITPEEVSRDQ